LIHLCPIDYTCYMTPDVFEQICAHIETTGDGVLKTCRAMNVDQNGFYALLNAAPNYSERYARAKEIQVDKIVEDAIDIADETSNDTLVKMDKNGDEIESANSEWINRSRLRVDTRKWLASKLMPKKYGDKLELSGDPARPLEIKITGVPSPRKAKPE